MPSTPPYPLEFRREAVRLLRTSGRSIPQIAKELGCSPQSLRNWARQLDVDEGKAEGMTSRSLSVSRPAPRASPNRWAAAATASITRSPKSVFRHAQGGAHPRSHVAIEAELRTEVFEYIELFFLRRRAALHARDALARRLRGPHSRVGRGPVSPLAARGHEQDQVHCTNPECDRLNQLVSTEAGELHERRPMSLRHWLGLCVRRDPLATTAV